jgi:predicted esterase
MSESPEGFTYRFLPGSRALAVLALHGTGGNEEDLLPLAAEIAPGAAVLSPRGRMPERGMPRFFRRFAEGVFDEENIRSEAAALAGFARGAAARHAISDQPLVALGYSNGANMAAALLLLHAGVLQGAVLLRAMLPLRPSEPPTLPGVPVLLLAGSRDPIVPRERIQTLAEVLRGAGARTTLRWAAAGHGLAQEEPAAARTWMDASFPPDPPAGA